MLIREYQLSDEASLIALWERCQLTRPWNDPRKDIARKLNGQPDWLLVGLVDGKVVASVMVGYDGHRGWINYLAVDPACRRQGLGRLLMEDVERRLLAMGCPKINLQIRVDNSQAIGFYESIGYAQDAVVSFGKRLIPD